MEIGSILLEQGLINSDQLASSQTPHALSGDELLAHLVGSGAVDKVKALETLAREAGVEFVDLNSYEVDLTLLKGFPQKIIYRQILFPIRKEGNTLFVATSEPLDLYPLDEISAATGMMVEPVLAEKSELAKLIKTHLGVGGETIEGLIKQKIEESGIELLEELELDGSELSEMAQEASVVRLVNEILLEAIETRTSDVHIESQKDAVVIRYRIDGILHTQPVPPEINHFRSAIVSRLKIMAKLNIAEKRLPQDGRIKLRFQGRDVDVRVSVIPMIHGESLVLSLIHI